MLFLFQETFILSVFDQTLLRILVKEKIRIFAASFSIEAKRLIRKTQEKVFSPQY